MTTDTPTSNVPRRILILRGGAVGDFILTLPVFAAIRAHWPDAHVELVAYPRVSRLVLETGLVDAFRSLDDAEMAKLFVAPGEACSAVANNPPRSASPSFPSGGGDLSETADPLPGGVPVGRGGSVSTRRSTKFATKFRTKFGEGFDLILSYLNDPDNIVRDNLERSGAGRVICHPPLPTDRHATDHLMEPLKELGVPVESAAQHSFALQAQSGSVLEDDQELEGEAVLSRSEDRSIGIHPGSGSEQKNWPVERCVSLAQRLGQEHQRNVFFIIGEADERQRTYLAENAPDFPIVENLDLYDLALHLSTCTGYVGNDSGITHLAAAVGIPTIALFGATDPELWGPRGEHVKILQSSAGLAGISVDEVVAALGI